MYSRNISRQVRPNQPMTNYNPNLKLPRPLWQIKEELAAHENSRPPNHDMRALADWSTKREALQMWVEYGESDYGKWAEPETPGGEK